MALVEPPLETGAPLGRLGAQPLHHLREAQLGVRDHQVGVQLLGGAHAAAVRTRPLPAVEREQPRVQGLVADAAGATEQALVVDLLGALGEHVDDSVAEAQPLAQHRLHAQASGLGGAHDDVDVVLVEAAEALLEERCAEGGHGPVDTRAAVAKTPRRHHHVLVVALAPAHHRAQHGDVLAAIPAPHPIEDAAAGERRDGAATLRAMLLAHLGVEQAQVVVELRDRGYGGVAPALAQALLDGHGGRDARQHVDVGPRHDLHELARVGGEAVDVAALAVGVDDVEGKRRLARAAEPGHHHQPVPRDIHVDALEVVLPGADDLDRPGAVERRPVRARRLCGLPVKRVPGDNLPGGASPAGRLAGTGLTGGPPPAERLPVERVSVPASVVGLPVRLRCCGPRRRAGLRLRLGQRRAEAGRRRAQVVLQVAAGMGVLHRRHFRRRARGDDLAAAVATLGTQVDDVVGALDDLGVVLDDHH